MKYLIKFSILGNILSLPKYFLIELIMFINLKIKGI
jgi:hypothetical protein